MSNQHDTIRAIRWDQDHLFLLDQRLLPHQEIFIECHDAVSTADAIRNMVVRGAPAIGISAAYGIVMAAKQRFAENPATWQQAVEKDLDVLAASRPTAVNLFWAINRMRAIIPNISGDPAARLLAEAHLVHEEDIAANLRMGELGASLLPDKCAVLTHCNTGSLATGGYGTALGVIRSGYQQHKIAQVFADETRPWFQGARLTAWELIKDHIPVRLLAEGAAASLMQHEKPAWVIVGADRVAANGDAANKIGTYSLAVLARQHGVKFMVVAPWSTVDMQTASGKDIPIEFRDEQEVLGWGKERFAPAQAKAWNPVFDVTPASLIDALITERGIIHNPDAAKLLAMSQKSGF
jgi:methylthioribose-1-phosphate isomerase